MVKKKFSVLLNESIDEHALVCSIHLHSGLYYWYVDQLILCVSDFLFSIMENCSV